MIRKVISGGQTGADQGALEGARLAGVATGGWAPKGWQTEVGPAKELLQSFDLKEYGYGGYSARTLWNVRNSQGTIVIARLPFTGGSRKTLKSCNSLAKPDFQLEWPGDVNIPTLASWVLSNGISVLNVAGNRESKNPGIQEATKEIILKLCGVVNYG